MDRMTWHHGPLAAADTETTGVDVDTARVVTAFVGLVQHGKPFQRKWLINPGVDIPEGATAVHGITTDHARQHGGDPATCLLEIQEALDDAWAAGAPVILHNAPFDLTLLDREMRRHCGEPLRITGPVIDTLVLDKMVDQWRKGKRTLGATAEHYGVKLGGAHDAAEDALAAARIAYRIAQQHPDIAALALPDLHDTLTVAARDQAASFAKYLTRQGKPADGVTGDWPIRNLGEQAAA